MAVSVKMTIFCAAVWHVVWYKFTDISELLVDSIIRAVMITDLSDDEGSKLLRNTAKFLPDYMT
jgi:hypothetical protein